MTYRWEQHYGIDRFDLSGPRGFPMGGLGWITRNADNPDSTSATTVTRDLFTGYITSMRTIDSSSSTYHWRICHAVVDGWHEVSTILPDLRDSATLGCLLLLVREAWKSPVAQVSPSLPDGNLWSCYINDEAEDRLFRERTEAEALVAALEAAPSCEEGRKP